jgi:hypothetical protein
LYRTARFILTLVLALMSAWASAETLLVEATIAEITERGFILRVGSESVPAEDESATRFWKERAKSEKEGFSVGDAVGVRLKTDTTPAIVREMADLPTWNWLLKLRKEPMSGVLVKAEPKWITLRFDDGSTFAYRFSDKSAVTLKGNEAGLMDLQEGMRLYAKGRLLPTLDTWLVTLSDAPPVVASKSPTKSKKATPKPLKLAAAGKLRGVVDHHLAKHLMFHIWYEGRLILITYSAKTTFTWNGERVRPSEIRNGIGASITYRRDQYGRILAQRVELFEVATKGDPESPLKLSKNPQESAR